MYESPILYYFLMMIFQINVSLPQGNPWIYNGKMETYGNMFIGILWNIMEI